MNKAITDNGGAALRLKLGWEMRVTKAVLEPLGNPGYITFLWSEEKRILLITASDATTPQSVKISKCNYERGGAVPFRNRNLIENILKMTKWERDKIYRVPGEFAPNLKAVAFDLARTSIEEEVLTQEVKTDV